MSAHARIGPSSADRWMGCPGSVQLIESVRQIVPEVRSEWADEGVLAHEVAALKARERLEHLLREDAAAEAQRLRSLPTTVSMWRHAEEWADLIDSHAGGGGYAFIEQRVKTSISGLWGTADAVILDGGHLTVADYKYGKGVAVKAEGNAQLRIYALAALHMFDALTEITEITTLIHQPRNGGISSETMDVESLREWGETVEIAAKQALAPDPPIVPSDAACRFCPALGWCTARARQVLDAEIADGRVLSADEMGEALTALKSLEPHAKALRQAATERIYSQGEEIAGWKVVAGRGRRVIADTEAAIKTLTDAGHEVDQVAPRTLVGVTALDEIVETDLAEVLGPLISVQEGPPSLVAEKDKRPSITPESRAMFTPYKGEK